MSKVFKSKGFTIGRESFAVGSFIEKDEFEKKFSARHFEIQVKSGFLVEPTEAELALYEKKKNTVDADFDEVDDGRDALVAELKELGVTDAEIGRKGVKTLTNMLAEAKEAISDNENDLALGDE